MKKFAFVLPVLAGNCLVSVSAASAVHRTDFYGRPGAAELSTMLGDAPHDQLPQIEFNGGSSIRRSPASNDRQRICVSYRIWTYRNATLRLLAREMPNCGWVPYGQRLASDPWSMKVHPHATYIGTAVVTWRTARRRLARATYAYDRSDYRCNGQCQILPGTGRAFLFIT
jgi:hypothetical protein